MVSTTLFLREFIGFTVIKVLVIIEIFLEREIRYHYTEKHDPDGERRDRVLYAALIQDIKTN